MTKVQELKTMGTVWNNTATPSAREALSRWKSIIHKLLATLIAAVKELWAIKEAQRRELGKKKHRPANRPIRQRLRYLRRRNDLRIQMIAHTYPPDTEAMQQERIRRARGVAERWRTNEEHESFTLVRRHTRLRRTAGMTQQQEAATIARMRTLFSVEPAEDMSWLPQRTEEGNESDSTEGQQQPAIQPSRRRRRTFNNKLHNAAIGTSSIHQWITGVNTSSLTPTPTETIDSLERDMGMDGPLRGHRISNNNSNHALSEMTGGPLRGPRQEEGIGGAPLREAHAFKPPSLVMNRSNNSLSRHTTTVDVDVDITNGGTSPEGRPATLQEASLKISRASSRSLNAVDRAGIG